MHQLYRHPKKIFLCLVLLTSLGLFLGWRLPIALYPDSAKPEYTVDLYLDTWTARDFLDQYGDEIQATLNRLPKIEKLVTDASIGFVRYQIFFEWGAQPEDVKRSIETAISQIRSQLPSELQRYLSYGLVQQNAAFFAASLFYTKPKLDSLYDEVAPQLIAKVNALPGVGSVELDNPEYERLFVTLHPERLAAHRLSPVTLAQYIESTIPSKDAGPLRMGDREYRVILQNRVRDERELSELSLQPLGRPGLKLKDVAHVELAPNVAGTHVFRANGQRSLILWVNPDTRGNIKAISEDVIRILNAIRDGSRGEIGYKILVNPAEFIGRAVRDVELNALIGGILAVGILMLFVGSLKLTIYSAIEIPLALIWAFILMWIFDVSLNLISLGGLALTAGMNIDASVVMIENIVRHFQLKSAHSLEERRERVITAVREVFWPLISSTVVTMIVFAPLSMTSGITYAILGDLAKAVIFSHGFSAVVALLLVPTVRIYMGQDSLEIHPRLAFFQRWFLIVERLYEKSLRVICYNRWHRHLLIYGSFLAVVLTVGGLYPFIRQEVIALPKTDSIWISASATGLTTTEELSTLLYPFEQKIIQQGRPDVSDVFSQIWSENYGAILVRIRSQERMDASIEKLRTLLPSTPQLRFNFFPWNPSELHIPRPPDLKVTLSGPEAARIQETQRIYQLLDRDSRFEAPETTLVEGHQLTLRPQFNYLENIRSLGGPTLDDLSSIVGMVLHGRKLGNLHTSRGPRRIELRFPQDTAPTPQDLGALPVVAGPYVLPLQSLVQLKQDHYTLSLYQENGKDVSMVQARLKDTDRAHAAGRIRELEEHIRQQAPPSVRLEFANAQTEIRESLKGLFGALLVSLLLIAVVLYAQFDRALDVFIVMAAIPLGLLGASVSLFAMKSTWSLNSILGVIMLGGICVNNSILLVSFFRQNCAKGMAPLEAAIHSSVVRLKPILITSLTTILAMIPIAFGFGEGADVLQPLGVAVSGGMLFSTLLTLFLIPALEVSFSKT